MVHKASQHGRIPSSEFMLMPSVRTYQKDQSSIRLLTLDRGSHTLEWKMFLGSCNLCAMYLCTYYYESYLCYLIVPLPLTAAEAQSRAPLQPWMWTDLLSNILYCCLLLVVVVVVVGNPFLIQSSLVCTNILIFSATPVFIKCFFSDTNTQLLPGLRWVHETKKPSPSWNQEV